MKLARLAVPAVAVVALLAGCSPSPGTAAQVDGATVSESEVQSVMDGCEALGIPVSEIPRAQFLSNLVMDHAAKKVANEQGVAIDEALTTSYLQQNPQFAPYMGNEECAKLVEPIGTLIALQDHMDTQQLTDELGKVDIEVNPRYGAWDPEQQQITGSGSMSLPSNPMQ